jgi:hypothetical protein
VTRTLALLDLDGVLANDTHRVKHALHKEWEQYFDKDKILIDAVWPQGRALADQLLAAPDVEIAYMTGRREDLEAVSTLWLNTHQFPRGKVYTRPFSAAGIPLANFKSNLITSIKARRPDLNVVLYDDDPEVIKQVRKDHGFEAGVHCTWHIKQKALVRRARV